ncbi:hypothetical protein [Nocardia vinacea]|uniref:hypothetical protein n=1 Tax=Nocardia vinacea TaxID=96468 RepID=UPI001469D776|nr:hypothetical protein [Nocardia vinacea]
MDLHQDVIVAQFRLGDFDNLDIVLFPVPTDNESLHRAPFRIWSSEPPCSCAIGTAAWLLDIEVTLVLVCYGLCFVVTSWEW